MNRYTLFVTLINQSGKEICRGIYAAHDKKEVILDDQWMLMAEMEKGMANLTLENVGEALGHRGSYGHSIVPKKILEECIAKIEIVDIEEV